MSQAGGGSKYPQGYFRNPLSIPISLSANFGELRPNHWHMGLDIRTNQRENQSVYAAAEGYIARIGIRPSSFGRFIVINHPNGLSTLYAHLNEFYPELEKYVQGKQREKESWAIELEFSKNLFPVKKGTYIAKSGNTGGSQGPHLHFEIRDTKTGKCLNPQLFGLPISDNISPVVSRLAIYNRSISTYSQTPQFIKLVKSGSNYFASPKKIITGFKKLSFAIGATDRTSVSSGPNGIYGASVYFDSKPMSVFLLDSIDYDETAFIDAQIDRRYRYNGGPYLQHLSSLPGAANKVYLQDVGTGVIELNDTLSHSVMIEVFDTQENLTTISFFIQYSEALAEKIKTPAYDRMLSPNKVNIIDEKDFEAFIPVNGLYDTVPFSYNKENTFPGGAITAQYKLADPSYPVHTPISIRLKTSKTVSENLKNKIVMVRQWKNERSIRKADWQNGWILSSYADFGIYQAYVDTVAPRFNDPGRGKDTLDLSALKRLVFTPTDNFSVNSFKAYLDGKWLMFTNDKGRNHIYNFDEQCPYGTHHLKVIVEDIAGNKTVKEWWFKRKPYTPPKKKPVSRKKSPPKKK